MTHTAANLLERQAAAAAGRLFVATADGLPRLAFSEAEAARMLGLCGKTLANARREGRIAYRREGVRVIYSIGDLMGYLESIGQPAAASTKGAM